MLEVVQVTFPVAPVIVQLRVVGDVPPARTVVGDAVRATFSVWQGAGMAQEVVPP